MKGSGTNKLPSIHDLKKMNELSKNIAKKKFPKIFEHRVNMYTINAHGGLMHSDSDTPNMFIIPERTWIIFLSRAGTHSHKVHPERDTILNKIRYLQEGETQSQWNERIHTEIEKGTLLQELLYSKENPEKAGIYEPGDLVNDMIFTFENNHPPWMGLGIWKLPLSRIYVEEMTKIENDYRIHDLPETKQIIAEFKQKNNNSTELDNIADLLMVESPFRIREILSASKIGKPDIEPYLKRLSSIQRTLLNAQPTNIDSKFLDWDGTNGKDRNLYKDTNEGKDLNNTEHQIYLSKLLKEENVFPTTIQNGKTQVKSYRIFITTACRLSFEDDELLKTVPRSISASVRRHLDEETCVVPRVLLNKETFERYSSQYPILQELIDGEMVKLSDLEPVLRKISGTSYKSLFTRSGTPIPTKLKMLEHVVEQQEFYDKKSTYTFLDLKPGDTVLISNKGNVVGRGVVINSSKYSVLVQNENTGIQTLYNREDLTKISEGGRHKTHRKKKLRRQTRKHT